VSSGPANPEETSRGMAIRRRVLGDAHVDQALAGSTNFDAAFQEFITEHAWGAVWARPGLDLRTRHLVTLALLAGLGREHELELHVRSIARTGVTQEELREVLLHVSLYAGVPAANAAFAVARRVFAENPHPGHG
jgi:4-carboxymuconolactone decarboxylase